MNLDPLSFSLGQITFLVNNLNKRNFKSSQSELASILAESAAASSSAAYEVERHLFRALLSTIDFSAAAAAAAAATATASQQQAQQQHQQQQQQQPPSTSTSGASGSDAKTSTTSQQTSNPAPGGKDHHQIQLLRDYVCSYLARPNFATLLCYCIDNPLQFQEVYIRNLILTIKSIHLCTFAAVKAY